MSHSSSVMQRPSLNDESFDEAIELEGKGEFNSRKVTKHDNSAKCCCNWGCTAKTIVKVAIPTIVIGAVLFGTVYYAVGRIENFLDVKLSAIANETANSLKQEFQDQVQDVLSAVRQTIASSVSGVSSNLNATVTAGFKKLTELTEEAIAQHAEEGINELSSTMNASIQEGIRQLNASTQAAIQAAAESLEETIREGLNQGNLP